MSKSLIHILLVSGRLKNAGCAKTLYRHTFKYGSLKNETLENVIERMVHAINKIPIDLESAKKTLKIENGF
jgi:hypothetical protein